MRKPAEPEAPRSLHGRRAKGLNGSVAVVIGEAGTTCSAFAPSLQDASIAAQEVFWLATAEGAYQ